MELGLDSRSVPRGSAAAEDQPWSLGQPSFLGERPAGLSHQPRKPVASQSFLGKMVPWDRTGAGTGTGRLQSHLGVFSGTSRSQGYCWMDTEREQGRGKGASQGLSWEPAPLVESIWLEGEHSLNNTLYQAQKNFSTFL